MTWCTPQSGYYKGIVCFLFTSSIWPAQYMNTEPNSRLRLQGPDSGFPECTGLAWRLILCLLHEVAGDVDAPGLGVM